MPLPSILTEVHRGGLQLVRSEFLFEVSRSELKHGRGKFGTPGWPPFLLVGVTAQSPPSPLPPHLPSGRPDRKGVFSCRLPGAGFGQGQERPHLGREECRSAAFRWGVAGGAGGGLWGPVSKQNSGAIRFLQLCCPELGGSVDMTGSGRDTGPTGIGRRTVYKRNLLF